MQARKRWLARPTEHGQYADSLSSHTRYSLLFMLVLAAWIVMLYQDTFFSMVDVWLSSATFTYGLIILPLSAYIVWQRRHDLEMQELRPSATGLSVLIISILGWYLARLASAQIGEHLAFVAIIGTGIWAVFGMPVVRVLRFSLLFAFLAVPFGEFLIPPLMDWTAGFTVWAIRASGIPVYLEGYYFSLPSGNFEVIAACSGIRYFLTTIILGVFFSYEKYETVLKRIVFVLLAGVFIIIANGIRAYLVVLTAHLTDMKYGTGQDHIYFGWLLFLIAIVAVFWVGSCFEDRSSLNLQKSEEKQGNALLPRMVWTPQVVGWAALVLLIVTVGPVLAGAGKDQATADWPKPTLPNAASGWEGPDVVELNYAPQISGADFTLAGLYFQDSSVVELHVMFFAEQSQGKELIQLNNIIFDEASWRVSRRTERREIKLGDIRLDVMQLQITNGRDQVLLWYWYDVGSWKTSSSTLAKVYHALQALIRRSDGDALVVIATPIPDRMEGQVQEAESQLLEFMRGHGAVLELCTRVLEQLPGACTPENGEPLPVRN